MSRGILAIAKIFGQNKKIWKI